MHRVLTASVPGAFLVEVFPVMLRIPKRFAKWKRWALEWHEKDTALFTEFLEGARTKIVGAQFSCGTHEPLTDR